MSTVVAERVGFEPTDHIAAINALAGRPIRPLWHLSWEPRSVARYPRDRNGGRVDECSRLESGRAQASGVRIPPVPPMGSRRPDNAVGALLGLAHSDHAVGRPGSEAAHFGRVTKSEPSSRVDSYHPNETAQVRLRDPAHASLSVRLASPYRTLTF